MQDLWLLRQDAASPSTRQLLAELDRRLPDARPWQSLDGKLVYVYLPIDATPAAAGPGGDWRRLAGVKSLAGASAGQPAPFHYVVETDVLAAHEEDLCAWYAQEHLPGLAAVPGTVRAARYVDPTGAPRYYACYDLTSIDTLGSPAWLAVRGTAWSSRVRPAFRNTRRTMFKAAAPADRSPRR